MNAVKIRSLRPELAASLRAGGDARSRYATVAIAPGGLGRDVGLALRLASLPGVESLAQPMMGTTTCVMTGFHGAGLPASEREYLRRVNSLPGSARAFARTVHDVIDCRGQTRHFLDRAHDVEVLPAMALFYRWAGDGQRSAALVWVFSSLRSRTNRFP